MHNTMHNNSVEITRRAANIFNALNRRRIREISNLQGNICYRLGGWLHYHHPFVWLCLFTLILLLACITCFVNTVPSIGFDIDELAYEGIGYTILVSHGYFMALPMFVTEFRFGASKIERDCFMCDYYLHQTRLSPSVAKRKIQGDLTDYQNESKFWKGILAICGLALSALFSSQDLQDAVFDLLLNEMWNKNELATIGIVVWPLAIICYFFQVHNSDNTAKQYFANDEY